MHFCMDWRSVKFDWNRARAFLVTAEEGSLSAAARALGMSQPTLGRQVSALEDELGVALFERIGRNLELTPSGLELVEHVRAMGAAATRVSLTASGQSQAIDGIVRVTASEAIAAYTLPAIVAKIRQEAPGITVEIVASNALSDLRRREADIAFRNAAPTGPDLIARKLGEATAHLFAARRYLETSGPFDTPAELARASLIGFEDNEPYLAGLKEMGVALEPENFRVLTANHLVHWELVRQGHGIGVMISEVGDGDPLVVRAAPWLSPFTFPVWLVAHREVRTSRRVRLVFDVIARELPMNLGH